MNTRLIIALTCAVAAAACNDADSKPAREPVVTTTAPSTATPGTTVTETPSSTATPNANVNQRGNTSTTSGTTSAAPLPATATTNNQPAITPAPAGAGAGAANNAGVADQTKNADNTKINDRDRHGALTPMDQGNSGNETKITAAIRKGLMGDKSLSFTAKNVKVITVGTKVTLRGPVKSDQEKAAIEALAKQTPGVSEVDDQLEVKK